MIVVRIELWPHGNKERARPLGQVVITNDGQRSAEDPRYGDYGVALSHAGKFWGRPGAWRTGIVRNHWRNSSPYHLVLKAIAAALGAPYER